MPSTPPNPFSRSAPRSALAHRGNSRHSQNGLSKAAFSLVEVVMALGIFTFAIMGLVGLIPVALTTHKEAKLATVLSQIKQGLAAEALLTDSAHLAVLNGFSKLFDVEGRELGLQESSKVVYRARIEIQGFRMPGADADSESLQRVVFYDAHDPTSDGALIGSAKPSGSVLVPKGEAN